MRLSDLVVQDQSYYTDARVRAQGVSWYDNLDEKKGLALVLMYDEDGNEERTLTPFHYEVCPICSGSGRHVNPSIDAHGLTADDFAADPDFAEQYMSGGFDVTCYGCQGRRVVPVPSDEDVQKFLERKAADDAAYYAECSAERRMGA